MDASHSGPLRPGGDKVSAMSTEAISRPADLHLPPEVQEVFRDLAPHLTPSGQANLINELIAAVEESRQKNDLVPLQNVIAAWYRTLIVRRDPEYTKNMDWAKSWRPRRRFGISLKDLRSRLRI